MVQRPLGNTGLRVSVLGLGTVKIGRAEQVKYPEPFQLPDDDAVRTLFTAAMDLGINLVDTAPAYGISEERLGRLLPGRRDEWVIASKCGEEFDGNRSTFDFSEDHTRNSVERSLRRLRTDYLDLVLIHSSGEDEVDLACGEAIHALAALREEGKVRSIGISVKTNAGGLAAIESSDVLMVTLNSRERESLKVIRAAQPAGRGILIKKALSSGHAAVTDDKGSGLVEAFRLGLCQPGVGSVIVGTINAEHLEQNVRAAEQVLE